MIITKEGNQFSSASGSYATSTHCISGDTCGWIEGNQVIVGVYSSNYYSWGGTVRWDFDISTPLQNIEKAEVQVEWPHKYGKGLHSPISSGSGSISVKSEGNTVATLNTNVGTCIQTGDWYAHACNTWSLKYDIPLNLIEPTTKVYVKTGSKTAWDVMNVKLFIYPKGCTSGSCCNTAAGNYYTSSDHHECSSADSCSNDDLCTHYECDGSGADASACTIKAGCSDCGNKDCDINNYYFKDTSNSAEGTNNCYYRDYVDCNMPCSSNSCQGCSCDSSSDVSQATAGICKYISGCSGSTSGTVENYPDGTPCGSGKECDGNGNCGDIPQCDGTDTSCGTYPTCINCNNNNGCYGNYYRDYHCISNGAGCGYTPDNCNDCSCSCGDYGKSNEVAYCSDGKDNDCDGLIDGNDPDCIESQDITIENGKIYVNGNEFLVKGVDYAPWLSGTGPDPNIHQPFPNEYDDVTDKVTHGGSIYVTDYSGDGKIQAWEVIQYDMETIKGVGANTIRTYASGEWHDKNLNGIIDRSSNPEQDEIVQGDLPNWMLDRIVDFCENNNMMVIIGYWVQEEDFKAGLQCNWDDLQVAKDTLKRVVERYRSSPAVLAWGIGNEVNGDWNHAWFTWTVNINDYLNSLFSYVRGIDTCNKPIMYAKYIGENTNFNTLTAEIIAPNAYLFTAGELVSKGEFDIPAPDGKAYLLGEFGHIIGHAEDHWSLSQQYSGGCFLEYNDVWWKGGDQAEMGLVEEYRAKKPGRYDVLHYLYKGKREFTIDLNQGWNLISIPLILDDNSVSSVFSGLSYSKLFYYDSAWKEPTEIDNTKGYWIKMNNAATLTVEGLPPENIPPNLNAGWNLIGYPFLKEKNIPELYTNAIVYSYKNSAWYSYNPSKPSNTLTKFKPGYGYWVKPKI